MKRFEQFNLRRNFGPGMMLGALSVLSSVIGGSQQNQAIERQNEANAEENRKNRLFNSTQAELAYQRQRTLIAEAREYDSAKAQRERLEAAGLNPYLMMDGGNAGTTQSMPAPSAASAPSPIPMQARRYEWMQNMAMQASQIRLINAQADKVGKDASLVDSQKTGQLIQNQIANYDLVWKQRWQDKITEYDLNEKDSNILRNDADRLFTHIKMINVATLTPVQAANYVADNALKTFSALNQKWDAKTKESLLGLVVERAAAEIAGIRASTAVSYSTVGVNNAQRDSILLDNEMARQTWNWRKNSVFHNYNLLRNSSNVSNDRLHIWNYTFANRLSNAIYNSERLVGSQHGFAEFRNRILDTMNSFGNALPLGISAPFPQITPQNFNQTYGF